MSALESIDILSLFIIAVVLNWLGKEACHNSPERRQWAVRCGVVAFLFLFGTWLSEYGLDAPVVVLAFAFRSAVAAVAIAGVLSVGFSLICWLVRRMFGTRKSRCDVERTIRERKIVICNLGRYGCIPDLVADAIGGLILNEVFETANRLSTREGRQIVDPTCVVMDEFQRFIGVDIEKALPTVRQMGLRLLLAHQPFSQLEREDVDLTQMIWNARSRLMFAASARDADLIADELAKLTFDPLTIKDQRSTIRQQMTHGFIVPMLRQIQGHAGSMPSRHGKVTCANL